MKHKHKLSVATFFLSWICLVYLDCIITSRKWHFLGISINKLSVIMGQMHLSWAFLRQPGLWYCLQKVFIHKHSYYELLQRRWDRQREGASNFWAGYIYSWIWNTVLMQKPLKCQYVAFYGFPFTITMGDSHPPPVYTDPKSWLHKCKCRINEETKMSWQWSLESGCVIGSIV